MNQNEQDRTGTPAAGPVASSVYTPTLTPKEHDQVISVLGIKKANTRLWQLGLLGILAGLYISFGGLVSLVALNEGMGRIAAGTVFSVGLVLVVIAGAELFTGNIIMIVGAITGKYSVRKLLRNWMAVYVGNWVGAYLFAVAVLAAGLLVMDGSPTSLGALSAKVADAKLAQSFGEALVRGILCNMLVILALIMATLARDIVSKILCCIFPIMTFVACGFEHCVANMFLIPAGLFAKGIPMNGHWVMIRNLVPVTLGNIVGGLLILVLHPNRLRQLWHLYRRA
jgi:formate/nitrite transporter